jgi:repressor LexA
MQIPGKPRASLPAQRVTAKQGEVFEFVRDFIERNQFAPSVREIAERFGFASPSAAAKHLHALEKKGLIRVHGTARSIEILCRPPSSADAIPILGKAPAGTPMLAVQNFDDWLSFREIFGSTGDLFALKVRGQSMSGAGIFDGDFVIVRSQSEVRSREIAVALLEEEWEVTIKRIRIDKTGVYLESENPSFQPVFFPRDQAGLRVLGKVIGVVRRF